VGDPTTLRYEEKEEEKKQEKNGKAKKTLRRNKKI
jgi:hypothetical protein